jgi:hypothetical protein
MKGLLLFVVGAVCGLAVIALPRVVTHLHAAWRARHEAGTAPGGARAHSEEKFAFTARGPMERVVPLFGADKERVWAPGWNPQFIHPLPVRDDQGMVFTVSHGHRRSVWVNTEFDLKEGRVQYVYVIPDLLVTLIAIKLTPDGQQTRIEVAYDRTALSAEGDAHVQQFAEQDRKAGPEWEEQVNGYLQKAGVGRR